MSKQIVESFTQTSDGLYDRHDYKVVSKNGDHMLFDNWADAQMLWWTSPTGTFSHIEVVDKKPAKGFK